MDFEPSKVPEVRSATGADATPRSRRTPGLFRLNARASIHVHCCLYPEDAS